MMRRRGSSTVTRDFRPRPSFFDSRLPEVSLPPPPDPALLEGTAWDRRLYENEQETRIRLRQSRLLASLDVDEDIFRLALDLERRVDSYARAQALLDDPCFETITRQWADIRAEETAVSRAWLTKQLVCTICGQAPGRWQLKHVCESCHIKIPSRPPASGIRSALSRARQAKAPATLTEQQWQRTVDHFEDRCAYCGGPWCLVEHATALPRGGTTIDNCLPACESCNNTKRNLTIEELRPTDRVLKALAWLRSCGRPLPEVSPLERSG